MTGVQTCALPILADAAYEGLIGGILGMFGRGTSTAIDLVSNMIYDGAMPGEKLMADAGVSEPEVRGAFVLNEMAKVDEADGQSYTDWLKSIGAQDSELDSLEKYLDAEYDGSNQEYSLLKQYAEDVEKGWISPLSGFDNYKMLYKSIETEIVGKTTSNGITINGQVPHFMQRVIGTAVDPEKLAKDLTIIRRSGVDLKDVKRALFFPEDVGPILVRKTGQRSIKYIGPNCIVSVNPDTGMLIQTNPRKR